jgi:hypothetical protein
MKRPSLVMTIALALILILPVVLSAQRGNVIIPTGSSVSVPQGASICADTIFANGLGHGTLTLAHPTSICAGTIVIPVELLGLSAVVEDNAVHIGWNTATETNNLGFEVQRRIASAGWTGLAFVEGSGSSTHLTTYTYTDLLQDVPAWTSVLHYRLKQIDFDGSIAHSPHVTVSVRGMPESIALHDPYPNPSSEQVFIPFHLSQERPVTIRLYNTAGRALVHVCESEVLTGGSHTLVARTSGLPAGTYFVELTTGAWKQTRKVTITR